LVAQGLACHRAIGKCPLKKAMGLALKCPHRFHCSPRAAFAGRGGVKKTQYEENVVKR
jgi:hypothetical protein